MESAGQKEQYPRRQPAQKTHLQFHIVVRPEEEWDRISLYPGPVHSPMNGGFEHVVYPRRCTGRGWNGVIKSEVTMLRRLRKQLTCPTRQLISDAV